MRTGEAALHTEVKPADELIRNGIRCSRTSGFPDLAYPVPFAELGVVVRNSACFTCSSHAVALTHTSRFSVMSGDRQSEALPRNRVDRRSRHVIDEVIAPPVSRHAARILGHQYDG